MRLALALAALLVAVSASAADPADPAATIGGAPITLAEVEGRAAGALQQVRMQEYEARKEALDALIEERLIADEAAARGVSTDALLAAEVDAKIVKPSDAEVEGLWIANKERFPDQKKEDLLPRIVEFLEQEQRTELFATFVAGLRGKADVRVRLEPPRILVPIDGEPARGPADAPITIVEFSDYECPFCARAEATVSEVLKRYDGKIRVVYRDFPLPFHPNARAAARAAACAGEQGKYWELHDALFSGAHGLDEKGLLAAAASLKLPKKEFEACLKSDRHDAGIDRDVADAEKAGVSGTPAFFVNGVMLSGAQPIDAFVEVIDEELERLKSR